VNAISPALQSGEFVVFKISVDGTPLDSGARILSIETWSEANRIPRGRLVIFDGEPDDGEFPLSNAATFVPGAEVVIEAGYGSDSKQIHSGTVIRHSIRIVPGSSSQLIVETADPLLKMTLSRNSKLDDKKSDADLISSLVKAAGGTVAANAAGTGQIETMIQYHASDWDQLLLRAEANGCIVLVADNKASIVSPTGSGTPVLRLAYGDSLMSFEATVDAAPEYGDGAVKSQSWSYTDQKVKTGNAASTSVTVPGNLTPAKLSGVFAVDKLIQQSGAFLTEDQLAGWSKARLLRAKLAQVQGSAKFQGSALVKPGDLVELAGVGDRLNGNAFVTATRHVIRDGSWHTIVQFGMAPESFASQSENIAAPPAAGLVPPIRGLHTGIVKQVAQDPTGDYRVLVTLPLVEGDDGVWARLGKFYASDKFGAIFYPEVGDEVVLGFMDEDPAHPVILASVYSKARAPTYPPNDTNDKKAIVTRSKMEITFDDKDVILQIKTPAGRIVKLDDKAKEIKIIDPFGNYVLMTESKVDIFSAAAMNITSTGDMNIKSNANMNVSAAMDMKLKALNIAGNADVKISMNGGAQAEFTASGQTTVKGAIVMIN
jgi:Rhs element Vgr protein